MFDEEGVLIYRFPPEAYLTALAHIIQHLSQVTIWTMFRFLKAQPAFDRVLVSTLR